MKIKDGSTLVDSHLAVIDINSKITIGKNCKFENYTEVKSRDSHTIEYADTNKRYNYSKDINIVN